MNATQDSISSATFGQDWSLDALGNWASFTEDSDGSGTAASPITQTRTHNKANEIETISSSSGSGTGVSPVNPTHDRNGNMTTMPKPDAPGSAYTATYDGWNRLVKLQDPSTSSGQAVAEYEYDGMGRRTTKETFGATGHERAYFYSANWQILEERINSDSDPEVQNVWGLRYVDELVQRKRDTNTGIGPGIGFPALLGLPVVFTANTVSVKLIGDGTQAPPCIFENIDPYP